jgi:carbonic anhydrase/acetyltransferase-like protein (isoleucine patch superfamily)
VLNILIKHLGNTPNVDPSAFIAPTAVLIGKISVDKQSRIMYGAIIDSEGSKVEIGQCCIICENAVLRATASGNQEYPVLIGNHVFISPQTTLIGCKVESFSYVATGATILQGAIIHSGAAIAVGAFVHANTVIPSNYFIPPNNIAVGDPVKIYSTEDQVGLAKAIKSVQFAKVAFNVNANWENRIERYRKATMVRSKEFGNHFNDQIIE